MNTAASESPMTALFKNYKRRGLAIGTALGLGAPLGSLLLRSFLERSFNLDRFIEEVTHHAFFYGYMMFATPIVFALFGYGMGFLLDKLFSQKQSLEVLNAVLESQSITDDMTGLYNHRHLIDLIDKELERAKRYHRNLSTVMLDIDDFKKINDRYGHLVGDRVLRELARLLKKSIRQVDTVARYGGDEFFIILPESAFHTAQLVAERIQKTVREYRFNQPERLLSLTVSVGISSFQDSKDIDLTQLVERTDQALLKAKSLGKDECFVDTDSGPRNLDQELA